MMALEVIQSQAFIEVWSAIRNAGRDALDCVPVMTITDFSCVDERDRPVPRDAIDSSVAFSCPRCAHPMLATLGADQHGGSPERPARCRKCRFECWIEVDRLTPQTIRLFTRSIS